MTLYILALGFLSLLMAVCTRIDAVEDPNEFGSEPGTNMDSDDTAAKVIQSKTNWDFDRPLHFRPGSFAIATADLEKMQAGKMESLEPFPNISDPDEPFEVDGGDLGYLRPRARIVTN